MAKLLFPPFHQFLDGNGDPLSGGTATFYQTGTSTKRNTYSDSDLTTPNPNPITLDTLGMPQSGGGAYVPVFGEAREYKVILQNASGTITITHDPVSGAASGINPASTLADLQAINTSGLTNGEIRYMAGRDAVGDGGHGFFRWSTSDLSAEVDADEVTAGTGDGGIYVGPDDQSNDGGNGAWVRLYSDNPELDWYGVAADGTTNDDAVIAALESTVTGETVDLHGRTVLVTSIPTKNRYTNGFFRINDFEYQADVLFPTYETLDAHVLRIDNGGRYHAWAQDSGWYYNGVLGCQWSGGSFHDSPDQHVIIGTSADRGKSMTRIEWGMEGFISKSSRRMSFAGNVIDGQEMYIVREGSSTDNILYGRRRPEVFTDVIVIESIGAGRLKFLIGAHGLKPGDTFRVNFWDGGAVGGIDPDSTEFTVESSFDTDFVTTGVGATSGDSVSGEIELFYRQGKFEAMDVDGTSIGAAVVAASADHSSQPVLFHRMSPEEVGRSFSSSQTGSFFTGMHGGGATGPYIAWIENPLQQDTGPGNTSTVRWVRKIKSTLNEGFEPSIAEDPANGNMMGFIRSQDGNISTGYPVRFWWTDDRLATDAVVVDAPWGNTFSAQSSVPCRISGDELHFCLIGSRFVEGAMPFYWGRGPVPKNATEAANFFDNATLTFVKNLYRADINQSGGSGVPSLAIIDDNTVALMVSSETPPSRPTYDGQPHMEIITIKFDDSGRYFSKFDPEVELPAYNQPAETLEVNTIRSASTIYRWLRSDSSGNSVIENGLSVTRNSLGTYTVSFVDQDGNAESLPDVDSYMVGVHPYDDSNNFISPGNFTVNDFQVFSRKPDGATDGGVLEDGAFTVWVIEIPDWARSNWT